MCPVLTNVNVYVMNEIKTTSQKLESISSNVRSCLSMLSGAFSANIYAFHVHLGDRSSLEGAIELKFVPFCSSLDALSDGILFDQS